MKIYSAVRLAWLSILFSTVLAACGLFEQPLVDIVTNLLSLASTGLLVYALSRLSDVSARFSRAFYTQLTALVLTVLFLICSYLPTDAAMLSIFTTLLSLAAGLFGLVSEFQFFWGLDEHILIGGYRYPARRIRWCFFGPLLIALFGGFAASFFLMSQNPDLAITDPDALIAQAYPISIALAVIGQVLVLVLLRGYLRAVREREEQDAPPDSSEA